MKYQIDLSEVDYGTTIEAESKSATLVAAALTEYILKVKGGEVHYSVDTAKEYISKYITDNSRIGA